METKQCPVCGIAVAVNTIYFKKRNAEYNLDHRGYDDDGSVDTLKKQIVCCPMGGYCMLHEYFEKECFDRRIVTCKEYRRWQKADIPLIARHFACCAFILMYRKQYKDAAYSMLKALWVCESDKSCNKKESENIRELTDIYFQTYFANDKSLDMESLFIDLDLKRRRKNFISTFYIALISYFCLSVSLPRNMHSKRMYLKILLFEMKLCLYRKAGNYRNTDIKSLSQTRKKKIHFF